MGRTLRVADGGYVYHVLNRGNARRCLFRKDADYDAFERILDEAITYCPIRLLSYCLMPNHWHLVLWPASNGELSRFLYWLTLTHVQRWHAHHHTTGQGHLYQGRFKSFPVQEDDHFYTVCRYVERNALRAGLVERAEAWRWSSLYRRQWGQASGDRLLSPWPLPYPEDWVERVNRPQSEGELVGLRKSVNRGQPYGGIDWVTTTADRLQLSQTLRPRGRPRKKQTKESEGEKSLFDQ